MWAAEVEVVVGGGEERERWSENRKGRERKRREKE